MNITTDGHSKDELQAMIVAMQSTSDRFYNEASAIGNHPFIEFTGLMNEYIKCCQAALNDGIDFSQCNTHSGKSLPMKSFQVDYVNEKLECIFTGRSIVSEKPLELNSAAKQ